MIGQAKLHDARAEEPGDAARVGPTGHKNTDTTTTNAITKIHNKARKTPARRGHRHGEHVNQSICGTYMRIDMGIKCRSADQMFGHA